MHQFHFKACKQCGRVGAWHSYCSNACKQRAYRARIEQEKRNLTAVVCEAIDEDFEDRDAKIIYSLLNTINSKKGAHAVDQALRIIINTYRSKIRTAKTIRKGAQRAITP
jgi:hypothetical protein